MQLTELTVVPVIMAAVELLKQVGVPNRLLPVLDVLLGVAFGLAIHQSDYLTGVINGVIYGLTAAGIYRSSKVTFLNQ